MAKRDRYSRWQRLPPVFRSGEHKLPGAGDELQRIILYLKGDLLDQAEAQADSAGAPSLQDYCALLLTRAIEIERIKWQIAEIEARRGPLEGLGEISDDLQYLAEWRRRFESRDIKVISPRPSPDSRRNDSPEVTIPLEAQESRSLPEVPEALLEDDNDNGNDNDNDAESAPPDEDGKPPSDEERPRIRIEREPARNEPVIKAPERMIPEVLDRTAIETVFAHVGPGEHDPDGFLPALRRGQRVSSRKAAELMDALRTVEADYRGSALLDRRLGYALYRLALEAQVLMTEVWPGAFDDGTIEAVRAVQGLVERILAGEEPISDESERTGRWEEDR